MGRLSSLRVHNFKSYRGTTEVDFGDSCFTSIIGPNGAGKSNIMDAISFVLGVRSSHLRSSKLKDLIYRGRLGDDDLAISSDEEDEEGSGSPQEAYVIALYEKSKEEVVEFKRAINVNGTSEYSIDGKGVSAAAYSDVLSKENILVKARNFLVFQGDVEQVASQSPNELTSLIETISGSGEHKTEYDRVKEELDKARETTNALFQKRRLLTGELRQYKAQKHESDSFKAKSKEKKNLVVTRKLWQLYRMEDSKNELLDKLEIKNRELKKADRTLKGQESHLEKVTKEYSKKSLQSTRLKSDIEKKAAAKEDENKKLIPINASREYNIKKTHEYDKRLEDLQMDIEEEEKNVKELSRQLKLVEKAKLLFENQNSQELEVMEIPEEGKIEYDKLCQKFLANGGEKLEQELGELKNFQMTLAMHADNHKSRQELVTKRIKNLAQEETSNQRNLEENQEKLESYRQELKSKKGLVNELRLEKDRLLMREFQINNEIKQCLTKLDSVNASKRENKRERKLRENIMNLQKLIVGVKGLVGDLCRPKQKKYETAVSTILGRNLNSIIVDNMQVAQNCVAYLKEQRAGVATFIPLDYVELSGNNLREIQNAKPVIETIEYDPSLERAMQYVCSNAVVCEDMATAKKIKWDRGRADVKIVTLDGSVIHTSGLMTGGLIKQQENVWDKLAMKQLIAKKDDLMSQLQNIQSSKPKELLEKQLLSDIDVLENKVALLNNIVKEIQRYIGDGSRELQFQELSLVGVESDILKISKEKSAADEKVENKDREIKNLKRSIYGDFAVKFNVSIEDYERSQGQVFKENEQERGKFSRQISSLKNKISSEKKRLVQSRSRIDLIRTEHQQYEQELLELSVQKREVEDRIDRLASEIEINNEAVLKEEKALTADLEEVKLVEEEVTEAKHKYTAVLKKFTALEADIEKDIIAKVDLLRSCKIENIEVPILEGTISSIPISGTSDNLIEVAEDIIIDYSGLSDQLKHSSDKDEEFVKDIAALDQELELLSPNSKAIERLQDVEIRLADLDEEHTALKNEEQQLEKKFDDIKDQRLAKFVKSFKFISLRIDPTYKELTASFTQHSIGGSAYLTIEDEDEPYNSGIKYHAMPPLKRFRDMELLSGGEKTIAALALLFAIHSYRPSPFFILDEVDAALDNLNVQRIANYISNRASSEFQFIVISLKNRLFEKSESLVGIYREQMRNTSKVLTLPLGE